MEIDSHALNGVIGGGMRAPINQYSYDEYGCAHLIIIYEVMRDVHWNPSPWEVKYCSEAPLIYSFIRVSPIH